MTRPTEDWKGVITKGPFRTPSGKLYIPPRVFVGQTALRQMIQETRLHPASETGKPLIGFVIPQSVCPGKPDPDLVVLGLIPVDERTTERRTIVFRLGREGGDIQHRVFQWWATCWEEMAKQSAQKPGYSEFKLFEERVPEGFIPPQFGGWVDAAKHLGDFHKHPHEPEPSGGDWNTAQEAFLPEEDKPYVLAPISVLRGGLGPITYLFQGRRATQKGYGEGTVEIAFHYVSQNMLKRGFRGFIELDPIPIRDVYLPQLPPLAWHLKDPGRLTIELQFLADYGCQARWFIRELDQEPPLDIGIVVGREDWGYNILIITNVNYPKQPPTFRLMPKANTPPVPEPEPDETETVGTAQRLREWFERVWRRNKEVETEAGALPQARGRVGEFTWNHERHYLLNLVMALDAQGKLRCEAETG